MPPKNTLHAMFDDLYDSTSEDNDDNHIAEIVPKKVLDKDAIKSLFETELTSYIK